MKEKGKKGCSEGCRTSVLAAAGVLLLVFAFFALVPATAQAAVEVRVDAPEYVEEGASFVATIVVDDVTNLNSAQFDLSFDKSVLEVKDVEDGEIGGEEVPIFKWLLNPDKDTVRVVVALQPGESVSGSGSLAEIEFEVKGEEGETSELSFSNGELIGLREREGYEALELEEIPADWINAEITIGQEVKEEGEDEEEPPEITAFEPPEAVVSSAEDESMTFKVTLDQPVEISWQLNGTEVQRDEEVTEAAYTNTSVAVGTWNLTAIATNRETDLSTTHTWIWNVASTSTLEPGAATPTPTPKGEETEGTTPTPTPTLAPGETPLPEEEATPTKPTPTQPSTEEEKTTKTKARPTPTLEPEEKGLPGFEAVFAIAAVVLGVAVAEVLQRRAKK